MYVMIRYVGSGRTFLSLSLHIALQACGSPCVSPAILPTLTPYCTPFRLGCAATAQKRFFMRCRARNYRQRPGVAKPPPQGLEPMASKLVDWDSLKMSAFLSFMPDEGEQRAGIIEEYLWGYINILREKNSDRAAVQTREMTSFLKDEEEERRFLVEDTDCLALRMFIAETEKKGVELVESWEEESRALLLTAHKEYLAEAVCVEEEIHRMHVATQAFDSVFLKLCQVNPYWIWRKLQFVEDEQREREFQQQRDALSLEEREDRRRLIQEYNRCYTLAVEMLAFSEKIDMYQKHEMLFTHSCRVVSEDSAIKIQAAFRGFLEACLGVVALSGFYYLFIFLPFLVPSLSATATTNPSPSRDIEREWIRIATIGGGGTPWDEILTMRGSFVNIALFFSLSLYYCFTYALDFTWIHERHIRKSRQIVVDARSFIKLWCTRGVRWEPPISNNHPKERKFPPPCPSLRFPLTLPLHYTCTTTSLDCCLLLTFSIVSKQYIVRWSVDPMALATSLSDGRFLYRNKSGNILLEARSSSSKFSLLFGGNAAAFAVEESKGLIAVLLHSDGDLQLCVYRFNGNEMTTLLTKESKKVCPRANQVMWVGEAEFIAVSDTQSGTMLYAFDGEKLVKVSNPPLMAMESNGAFPLTTLQYVGVLDQMKQTTYFYDSQKEKVVETYVVPTAESASGPTNTSVCSTSASKNFVFMCHTDGSLHSVYVTKGSVRQLSPMQLEFMGEKEKGQKNLTVLCAALSSGQVFVALDQPVGGPHSPLLVLRYKYIKKLATLVVIEKAVVPCGAGSALLALSVDGRCLLRTPEKGGVESISIKSLTFRPVIRPEGEGVAAPAPQAAKDSRGPSAARTSTPATTTTAARAPLPCVAKSSNQQAVAPAALHAAASTTNGKANTAVPYPAMYFAAGLGIGIIVGSTIVSLWRRK
eukprot:gene11926-8207_t